MHQVVTVSIGIACMIERRFDALRVFVNAADGALYDAKGGGRNRVVCESDLMIPSPSHAVVHGDENTKWHDQTVQYIKDKGSVYASHKK
jgi:hypothetical protein